MKIFTLPVYSRSSTTCRIRFPALSLFPAASNPLKSTFSGSWIKSSTRWSWAWASAMLWDFLCSLQVSILLIPLSQTLPDTSKRSALMCQHSGQILILDTRLHLAVSVGMSVSWSVRPSHFWVLSGFGITAPAQPAISGLTDALFVCLRYFFRRKWNRKQSSSLFFFILFFYFTNQSFLSLNGDKISICRPLRIIFQGWPRPFLGHGIDQICQDVLG